MDAPAQPAIGYSITVDVAPGRQMVFQHFVGDDEDDATINARLDRLMSFADRQRAKYELPDILAERLKMRDEIAQMEQDKAEAEANHQRADQELDRDLARLATMKATINEEGYAAHTRSGRQGAYKPVGAAKSSLERIENDVAAVAAQREKNNAEREQFLENMRIGIERRHARIATLDEKQAALERALT